MNKTLKESLTRKHFQMVADTIKAVEDPKKRSELAQHHAGIFAKANPRFDHKKFMAAANVTESDEKWFDEAAKWRTTPKAHVQHDPDDSDDSRDYDYYHENPKSTGYKTSKGDTGKDPLGSGKFRKHLSTVKVAGPRHGKLLKWAQDDTKNSIKRRLGSHSKPNLPESLAYEGEGTYTVHHGTTGEKVHTGMSKRGAMDAAIKLHAKTGVKPKVYHRAISGYGGRSYGKPKQEIAIEGTDMANKPTLTESQRIEYKAAFRDALNEAARKYGVGDTVLVGTRKGYVVSRGADHVDVLDHHSNKIETHHQSKVVKHSKAALKKAHMKSAVMNATNPNSETYMSSSYEYDFDYDFLNEGALQRSTHEPVKQDNLRNAVEYLKLKHAYSKKKKNSVDVERYSKDLDTWKSMLDAHIAKHGKLSAPKVREESYEPKPAVQGAFDAPRSEFDSTPGYNVLGSEKIHGKTVKYVRMGSFFAPVVVVVDGEPWEDAEGQPIKFAGQNVARDEMWAKLNPATQAAFDAAQSGKGGQEENEVEDEKVFAPSVPGMEECVEVDAWDELVGEVVIEGVDHSKLSPEESSHIKKNAMPTKMIPRGIGNNIRQVPVNHATVTLPYNSDEHRQMADSIAKKLGLKKYFRGKRERKPDGASKHNTNKANAKAVALYSR